MVSAAEVGTTNLIAITVKSANGAKAAAVANAYAEAFASYEQSRALNQVRSLITSYQNTLKALTATLAADQQPTAHTPASTINYLLSQQTLVQTDLSYAEANEPSVSGGVTVAERAVVPTSPSSPKPVEYAVLGLIAGIILGLLVVLVLDRLDDSLNSKADVERITGGLPILAAVPTIRDWRKRSEPFLTTIVDPMSPPAEAFWSLRASLEFAGLEQPLRTILVTSPSSGEGKSSTVANLGVVLAEGGNRVLLVSGDLRRPRVERFFGDSGSTGFTSVILGSVELTDTIHRAEGVENLWILDSGPLPADPHRILASGRTADILQRAAKEFDYVLLDSPPLLPVADTLALARHTDATLLVVSLGQTRRRDLEGAMSVLASADAPGLGIILNNVTSSKAYGYSYLTEDRYYSRVESSTGLPSRRPVEKRSPVSGAHRKGATTSREGTDETATAPEAPSEGGAQVNSEPRIGGYDEVPGTTSP
jgi:capsular exopolysaccharide synthesis family protein